MNALQINVAELKRIPGGRQGFNLRQAWLPLAQGEETIAVQGPVAISGEVANAGESLLVSGRIAAALELSCSRCLGKFRLQVDTPLEEQYGTMSFWQAIPAGAEMRDEVRIYGGDTIDLAPAVNEALLLALPMKPLCDEACQGICPKCGSDLNAGPCQCPPDGGDPRLAGLSKLLQ